MVGGFVFGMPSRRTNNFPESGRGLGHVTLQFLAVRSAILATAWLLVVYGSAWSEINFHSFFSFIHSFMNSSDVHIGLVSVGNGTR